MNTVDVYSLTRFHYFALAEYRGSDICFQVHTAWPNFAVKRDFGQATATNHFCNYRSLLLTTLNRRKAGTYLDKLAKKSLVRYQSESDYLVLNSHIASVSQLQRSRVIVDHGGLNPILEEHILRKEASLFGFGPTGNQNDPEFKDRLISQINDAQSLFVMSNAAISSFQGTLNKRKDFYRVNSPAVNTSTFFPMGRNEKKTTDTVNLLFVGASVPRKGIHRLLAVLHDLRNHFNIHLTIVGSLPSDRRMDDIFKKYKRTVNFKQVGIVKETELVSFYNQADIFILPSLADGWGMVTNQALACGLPVIVSDMCGSSDLVDDHNGLTFEAGNDESLKNAITQGIVKFVNETIEKKNFPRTTTNWSDFAAGYARNIMSLKTDCIYPNLNSKGTTL